MTKPHTLSSFDQRLDAATAHVLEMGALVSAMLEQCLKAYLDIDCTVAQEIIHQDLEIDRREAAIHDEVMDILGRLQPVACDLRLVLAIERAASNLERVGDKAKSIAKRCMALDGQAPRMSKETKDLLRALDRAVTKMLKDALTALERHSYILAAEVESRDATADELYDDLFHHVVAQLRKEPDNAAATIHSLFVGKSLERVGDHAANIAEEVRFILRGREEEGTRPTS